MQLLLGCGGKREKRLVGSGGAEWRDLVTLDLEPRHVPDVLHDLDSLPLPFADDSADEIHAYHVLEHCGRQGDWRAFFAQWADFWRILQPGGLFFGIVPHWQSVWAWGDPSHTRLVMREHLTFLCQTEYDTQVGQTAMSDYRGIYRADFDIIHMAEAGGEFCFALRAVKPSRISVPCPS